MRTHASRQPQLGRVGCRRRRERRHRVGEHLADVGPRVDRDSAAEPAVGDPALDHRRPPGALMRCGAGHYRSHRGAASPAATWPWEHRGNARPRRRQLDQCAGGRRPRRTAGRPGLGRVQRHAAVDRRPRRELAWRSVVPGLRAARPGRGADAHDARAVPPGLRFLRVSSRTAGGRRSRGLVRKRRGRFGVARGQPRRHLAAAAQAAEDLGPDLHQARPDHLLGRGAVPRGAGARVQAAAATRCRPSPSTLVRAGRRGRSGRDARGHVRVVRPRAPRRGLHRPGARGRACAPASTSW